MSVRLRTALIRFICMVLGWVHHIRYEDSAAPIGWRDHLRWFLEDRLSALFMRAYLGSVEELQDGIDLAREHADPNSHGLTQLQHEILSRRSEWLDEQYDHE